MKFEICVTTHSCRASENFETKKDKIFANIRYVFDEIIKLFALVRRPKAQRKNEVVLC